MHVWTSQDQFPQHWLRMPTGLYLHLYILCVHFKCENTLFQMARQRIFPSDCFLLPLDWMKLAKILSQKVQGHSPTPFTMAKHSRTLQTRLWRFILVEIAGIIDVLGMPPHWTLSLHASSTMYRVSNTTYSHLLRQN